MTETNLIQFKIIMSQHISCPDFFLLIYLIKSVKLGQNEGTVQKKCFLKRRHWPSLIYSIQLHRNK